MNKRLTQLAALTALAAASTFSMAQSRPADIVTPIDATVLATKITPADATKAGRVAYDKPTPENTIFLFVDHQIGLMAGVRDFASLAEYKNNVVALAKMAKALGAPVLLTSSNAQWQNGDLLPELKEIFPSEPIYRRTGIINAYEDPGFRKALEAIVAKTGRRHIVISGVTLGTCVAMPTYSMLNDGYAVYPVVDASGAWSRYEAEAAMTRMSRAGANVSTVFAFGAELQADWKKPTANAMFDPFIQNLPEYGFVVQNFMNNADPAKRPVKDPFAAAK
jgi:nicotinamidase-related amidase